MPRTGSAAAVQRDLGLSIGADGLEKPDKGGVLLMTDTNLSIEL